MIINIIIQSIIYFNCYFYFIHISHACGGNNRTNHEHKAPTCTETGRAPEGKPSLLGAVGDSPEVKYYYYKEGSSSDAAEWNSSTGASLDADNYNRIDVMM